MKLLVVVFSLLLLLPSLALPQSVGTAYLSSQINWSQTPDLYFTVVGGQPNVCGHFTSIRNGSPYDYGWVVCTDANGGATLGPYTWASRTADQTDTSLQIQWPNGTITYFTSDHVWDITCPTPTISYASSTVSSRAFNGSANDSFWGAGFDGRWTSIYARYLDATTGLYWAGGATYDSSEAWWTSNIVSSMPSHNINWALPTTSVPPASAHTPGHAYVWSITVFDGDHRCNGGAFQAPSL
jgi:hypothetical protein